MSRIIIPTINSQVLQEQHALRQHAAMQAEYARKQLNKRVKAIYTLSVRIGQSEDITSIKRWARGIATIVGGKQDA